MADDRFYLGNFIVDADKAFIHANIKKLKDGALSTYIVPPKHAHRLDLISDILYNTVNLKSILIYVNDIVDISVVVHGYKLQYPSLSSILAVLNETSEYI